MTGLGAIPHHFVVLRHGRTRKDVRRKKLRFGKPMSRAITYKVSTPFSKKEDLETVGELSEVCSKIVLTCPVFGAHRQTRPFMVSELFGKSYHEVEQMTHTSAVFCTRNTRLKEIMSV